MSGEDPDRLFEESMAGVEPLRGKGRRIPSKRKSGKAAKQLASPPKSPASWVVDRIGGRIEGYRRKTDQRVLTELVSGELPPEDDLDLHRMTRPEALAAITEFLRRSHRKSLRCVLLIHGRGMRSERGPVLREAVADWLTQRPLAAGIQAFATAGPGLGGKGATLVLLRKRRK